MEDGVGPKAGLEDLEIPDRIRAPDPLALCLVTVPATLSQILTYDNKGRNKLQHCLVYTHTHTLLSTLDFLNIFTVS
jgi:hypothetical protein